MRVRLLTYNIRYGGVGREELLSTAIRDCAPDIVVLQEATRPEVVERLASLCGMVAWGSRRGHSLGFMCRVPVEEPIWHRPRGSRHAFIEIAPLDIPIRVFGVHLSAVHAAWTEARRERELRALLFGIRQHQHGFHVLAGDFNTLAPNELLDVRHLPYRLRALVWLSGGVIRWRTIQIVLDARYIDGFRAIHPTDSGLTFPTWNPHVRLDYVFVPDAHRGTLTDCQVARNGAAASASDHFPVVAEFLTAGGG